MVARIIRFMRFLCGLLATCAPAPVNAYLFALTVEAPVLTWQRVDIALAAATPGAQAAFRALKSFMEQQSAIGKSLQFVAIASLGAAVNLADVPCTLYGVYLKKKATATAAFAKLNNSAAATAGGANGANMTDTLRFAVASQERVQINLAGQAFATGLAAASETTAAGGANTVAADSVDGFVLIGG